MISAKSLKKSYNEESVIHGIDLSIEEKEYAIITGKSGSGKSTLLYLLSGLEKPTEGNIYYNEICLNELNDKNMSELRKTKFGFIFQFYNLVPTLTVYDNICLPLNFGKGRKKDMKEKILEYLELLELKSKINMYPHQLSGGQQQRVAIARALAIDPDIIFADEPTGNLDSVTSDHVLEIFKYLHDKLNKTIIMVTHDNTISGRFATRQIILSDGRIVEDGR